MQNNMKMREDEHFWDVHSMVCDNRKEQEIVQEMWRSWNKCLKE